MTIKRIQFLVFALLYCAVIISARYNDPNCGWADASFRAVGDWAIDAGSSSNWDPAEPKGLMHDTNVQSCEYAVDVYGLQPNKVYNWKVTIGNTWENQWGCVGRGGPNCQFSTPTGSIRFNIVGSFAYPLTTEVIQTSSNPTTTSSPGQSDSNSGKKVFAHYMVGFAFPSDQSFFDGQIKRAKSAGIDGFALNVGIDTWQPNRVAEALDAAKNNGDFTMFISFDMTSLNPSNDLLRTFHFAVNYSNYYKVNGRPFFSTFNGENLDTFWADWKVSSGFNPYFCPSWPNYSTEKLLESHPVADCIFTWNAWPANNSGPGAPFDTTGDKNLIASAKATGKKYMAPLAPWFYTHVWGPGWKPKNWIFGSEKLLPERWQQIVSLQPDFVQIITWNDYSESSYVCNISSDLPTDMGGINSMINSPQPMKHDAWLELSKHYIQWYKNNARPTVTNDQFYWWYRIHPKNNVTGDVPQANSDAQDCVVVHSIIKSVTPNGGYYNITVDLNGSMTSYKVTQLEQTECINYPANPGYVTISLIGPDNNAWWAEGHNAPQQSSGNNFNAFTNYHIITSP